jgi:hypothetical protein
MTLSRKNQIVPQDGGATGTGWIGADFSSQGATGGAVSDESMSHLETPALFHNRQTFCMETEWG